MNPTPCQHLARSTVLLMLAAHVGTPPAFGQTSPPTGETAVELSPFVVRGDTDVGYLAGNTLAGSRLNTSLRDTAASISVLTSEFINDLGAQTLEEVAEWMTNMTDERNTQQASDNNYFVNPTGSRGRGVATTRTRNYFTWMMPADTYNLDRIEDARGPNSVLFGIGSAGGVINLMTKQANTTRSFVHLGGSTDNNGSYRGTLDWNRALLHDRLGVRLNAVHNDRPDPQRRFASFDNKQIDLAVTFKFDAKTRLRAEYEWGEVRQVIARPGTATDGLTTWLSRGSKIVTGTLSSAQQTAAGVSSYGVSDHVTLFVDNGVAGDAGMLFNVKNQYQSSGTQIDFPDDSIVDYSVNTGGPGQFRTAHFNAFSVFLDRQFGKKTFVELAYNHQQQQSLAYHSYVSGTTAAIRVDPNATLPDGRPNPYAGRLFTEGVWNRFRPGSRSDETRLSVTSEFDFGKWGNYRVAAMASHNWSVDIGGNDVEAWAGRPFSTTAAASQNYVWRRSYVTAGDWATYWLNSPVLTPVTNMKDPISGRTLASTWVPGSNNLRDDPSYLDTMLLGVQARYFKNRLVVGTGFRKDWLTICDRQAALDPASGIYVIDYDGTMIPAIESSYSGVTKTLGAVFHLTNTISVFYNRSSNFGVPNTAINMAPDGRSPPNSDNEGQDAGLSFELFKGRVYVRGNYFEMHSKGGSGMLGGSASRIDLLNDRIMGGLLAVGAVTRAEYDAKKLPEVAGGSYDDVKKGYEVSVTGNLTKNWRLNANYSYTDGETAVWGPEYIAWWSEMKPYYEKFDQNIPSTAGVPIGREISDWGKNYYQPLLIVPQTKGITGNRKQKMNLYTNYRVESGWFRGLSMGGGYRYQGPQKIGNYTDLTIQYGNSFWTSTASLGYRMRRPPEFLRMKGLNLQLNVTNLTNNRTPIVNRRAVSAPGTPGSVERVWGVTIPQPRVWRFTTNVEF